MKIDQMLNAVSANIKIFFNDINAMNRESHGNRELRVVSIALRIFGTFNALSSICYVFSGIAKLLTLGTPLAVMGSLVAAIFLAVVAHDCIVISNRISTYLNSELERASTL